MDFYYLYTKRLVQNFRRGAGKTKAREGIGRGRADAATGRGVEDGLGGLQSIE